MGVGPNGPNSRSLAGEGMLLGQGVGPYLAQLALIVALINLGQGGWPN